MTPPIQADVTIFIPVYNGANFVAHAIDSVLGQSYTNYRLVVSDNCSTDKTREIVEGYLSDPRIRLAAHAQNIGMVGNFNACLRTVETKYYMVLCHDDYLLEASAIEKARLALEGDARLVSVYSNIAFVDRFGRPLGTRRFGRSGCADPLELVRKSVLATRNLFGIPILNRACAARGLSYDESIPYVMDVDLSFAIAKGALVYYIPEALIANRYHRGNSTFRLMGSVRQQDLRVAEKHGLALSRFDRARMRCNSWVAALQKRLFQLYITYFRR